MAGPRRGIEDASHSGRVRQREANHVQRLLHVADRHQLDSRGDRPTRCARKGDHPRTRLWLREFPESRQAGLARSSAIEMDSISGRIARLRHPEHDIRIENFRDTRLPENRIDAVVGNVPFADVKLDHNGQKYLAPRLLLRQVDRRLEARRSARPGDIAFHTRQAKRRDPRVSRLPGRLRGGHSVAVGCLQTRRNRRGDRHRLSSQA